MKRLLPLLAAGLLGALFAGAAVYQATRTEAQTREGTADQSGGCGGNCCAPEK